MSLTDDKSPPLIKILKWLLHEEWLLRNENENGNEDGNENENYAFSHRGREQLTDSFTSRSITNSFDSEERLDGVKMFDEKVTS